MKNISELKDIFAGKPIAVLGAGPNLPSDLDILPEGTVMIGVNNRAEDLVDLDYVCFADSPKFNKYVRLFHERYIGRRITFIREFTDWLIDVPHIFFGKTFPFAVWVAEWMGGDPVILCGFDCFMTGNHHDDDPAAFIFDKKKTDKNIHIWRRVAESIKHPERLRAISGPLIHIFGKYEN